MSHPYFRSHYLLNNSLRKSGNEKKSTLSNSFTNSNSQPDQVQDHSTNSTLKSYLSDRNVSNSNPTPQTNTNSVSPNKSRTLPIQHSSRRSRRSQRSITQNGTSSSKRLTEEQLRQKLAQYEMYIASQLDKVDNVEKKNAQEKKPKLSDEQWQQMIFQRVFLGANSILLLCAFIMLALACILDPNPIHKLDSKGGFYAFNAVVLIFLALLGLYGMRPLRKKLLLAYASSIAFLLLFRLITGLVMLIALENNQSELIFLLSAGLIEMMLAILALANAYNEPTEFNKPNIISVDGQAPVQVLCKDDNKKDKNENNSFSKNSTLRRSMNANHGPRPTIQEQQKQQQSPSLVTGIQTTTGDVLYLSPENLIFNERSVDAPSEAKKLEQRNYNYTTNITQYSTIAELVNSKKDDKKSNSLRSSLAKQSKDEIITKTTLVAKPFQLNKDLLNKTNKPPVNTKESNMPRSTNTLNKKSSATTPSKPTDTVDRKVENNYQLMNNRPTHKRHQSSSFLTNTNLPYRTSTPSNQMPSVLPSIQQIGSSSYSPQNTTSSIGTTSKASIFDYNYSPLNLNQISHHIINSQKPATSGKETEPINRMSSLNRSLPSLATTRQNILMNKMNFLNNNTYDANQYKQNIINSVLNDDQENQSRAASASRSQNKWPKY